jgi:hypothetical protein
VITIRVGWLALAAVLVLVALFVLAVRRPAAAPVVGVDPARVRAACAQYAALDLSGWASVCRDAGYQQTVYAEPAWPATWWPTARRVVQPEDLDR